MSLKKMRHFGFARAASSQAYTTFPHLFNAKEALLLKLEVLGMLLA
jgi:hypothetical protein